MNQRTKFLKYAKSLVGTKGGDVFRRWYNSNVGNIGEYKWPWCAAGISYCAAKTNIDSKIIFPTASAITMLNFFKNQGRFKPQGTYIPKGGDIVIFRWATATSPASHVGIVDFVKEGYVHTVEFNSGSCSDGAVAMWKYGLTNQSILGYGVPDYEKSKVKVKRKSFIRSNPWHDHSGVSSTKLKELKAEDKVKYIKDNGDGWAKVKSGTTTGYIQNKMLRANGVSLFPYARISKSKKLKSVDGLTADKFPKNQKVTVVCTIKNGTKSGNSIVRINKKTYYAPQKILKSFEPRTK